MLSAIAHPPHLAGICPVVTASNYHDGWTYQSGALEQWFDQNWSTQLATKYDVAIDREKYKCAAGREGAATDPVSGVQLRRASRGSRCSAEIAPYYLDWLAHPSYDEYWKQWSIEEHFSDIRVPALHIGGWYDIFLGGTLRNYMGIKAHGGSEEARKGQRLLIQIGGHAGFGRRIGDVEFGDEALKFSSTQVVLDWYDYLFKGVQNEFSNEGPGAGKPAEAGKPVHIFVMGANKYQEEADSASPQAKTTRYYLHSGGSANSLGGDGGLSTAPPKKEAADKFTYDPANPVTTIGGSLCCDAEHYEPGPRDQRADKIATMCWFIPPSRVRRIWKLPVRLQWNCGSNLPRWTPILRQSSWTSRRTGLL